jgi:nucleotide-binding universal stress UspA family protein
MTTTTILVPLDGSALAEQALPYAQLLARALSARIHLLRAISRAEQTTLLTESVDAPSRPPAVCEQCALTHLCGHSDCYIAEQARQLRAADLEADADMRVGTPAEAIAALVQDAPESLIAMATHDERGLQRWLRGSVADTLIHATTAPLLLVPGCTQAAPASPSLARILVPLDSSALARLALPIAIELAAHAQAELILLWVVAPSIEAYLRAFPAEADAHRALHDQAAEALATFPNRMPAPTVRMTTAVGIGSPAQAIAEEAARRHADLIVMATHGYTGLQRWRLGSVANTVLHATPTPLLLVRGAHN